MLINEGRKIQKAGILDLLDSSDLDLNQYFMWKTAREPWKTQDFSTFTF